MLTNNSIFCKCICLLLNKIYCDLFKFTVRLLLEIHLLTLPNSTLITFTVLSKLSEEKKTVVSSAYITNCKSTEHLGKSFIYIKNKIGPNTLPCATPQPTERIKYRGSMPRRRTGRKWCKFSRPDCATSQRDVTRDFALIG